MSNESIQRFIIIVFQSPTTIYFCNIRLKFRFITGFILFTYQKQFPNTSKLKNNVCVLYTLHSYTMTKPLIIINQLHHITLCNLLKINSRHCSELYYFFIIILSFFDERVFLKENLW